MTTIDITRRALLGGLASSAVPGLASAHLPNQEHPHERVDRLSNELAEAMDDYMGGKFHALVYPSSQGTICYRKTERLRLDPTVELRSAIGSVKMAMLHLTGKMPEDFSQIDDRRSVVALAVLPDHKTELRWFFDSAAPLLADDAGTGR
jgi:hypothetical protein